MALLILRKKGVTLVELCIAMSIFGIIGFLILNLYQDIQKNNIKSQQFSNLQQLAKNSLNEIANEIRQCIQVRTTATQDIQVGQNFTLLPDGSNQVCILVPKLSHLGDSEIADRIIYKMGNYQGCPKMLLQQLITYKRDATGNVVVDVTYPPIPILINMENYRSQVIDTITNPLPHIFGNPNYSYDYVTFYWDYDPNPEDPRGVMAIGITVSVRQGGIQSKFSTTTVVTSRPISGVPR